MPKLTKAEIDILFDQANQARMTGNMFRRMGEDEKAKARYTLADMLYARAGIK